MAISILGHLVEYIQTDIWVRFQKLRGQSLHLYLCRRHAWHGHHDPGPAGRAQRRGVIADMREHHVRDFAGFDIEFDNYGSTHSAGESGPVRRDLGRPAPRRPALAERDVTQLYDPQAGTFLADRFVKGTCPRCKSPDQYGDNCENCGHTYSPTDLIDPVSTLSGREARDSHGDRICSSPSNGCMNFWTNGRNRAITCSRRWPIISRDIFWASRCAIGMCRGRCPISASRFPTVRAIAGMSGSTPRSATWPRRASGATATARSSTTGGAVRLAQARLKFTISSARTSPISTRSSGRPCSKASGFSLPRKIHIHGFLTVGGEKMSKTKGTFVRGATYLKRSQSRLSALLLRLEAHRPRR